MAALATAALLAASCGDEGGRDASPETTTTSSSTSTTASSTRAQTAPSTSVAPTTLSDPIGDTSGLPERPPRAAATPAALGAQIRVAEQAIRDPSTTPARLAQVAVVQQVAYRHLALRPEIEAAVLAEIPAALHRDVRRNLVARRELRAMHRTLADTVPAWRIVAPPPAADLLRYYQEAEREFGISWPYLAAVNLVETGMGRIRGTSVSGAQGPMQFMPATWDAFGEGDINDPRDAILAAGRYLAHNHGATDIATALWNYNHSDRYVRAVMSIADVIRDDPHTFHGYFHWGIFYLSTAGDLWLPEGYEQTAPVPAADYLAAHPQ
jgi:membrane-bound lytic murein transglycosylase B